MNQPINEVGHKYERLTVFEFAGCSKDRKSMWKCQCECGNIVTVTGKDLRSGHTKSCGCYKNERVAKLNYRHGMTKTRIYKIWVDMISRCKCETDYHFQWYGARGIKVCDEWHDFIPFYLWSEKTGYTNKLTIDRKDVNGNYGPDNCKWSTMKEQANNRTNNVYFEWFGQKHSLSEWSEILGIRMSILSWRIYVGGWTIQRAFQQLPRKSKLTA